MDDVTIDELLHMREQGMTNRQIAEMLDVGYETVKRYIGKQPKGVRKPRECKEVEQPKETASAPAASACLVVQNREIELCSANGNRYTIDCKQKQILICAEMLGENSGLITFDELNGLISKVDEFRAELQAIASKIGALTMQNEMW